MISPAQVLVIFVTLLFSYAVVFEGNPSVHDAVIFNLMNPAPTVMECSRPAPLDGRG